MPDRPSGTVTFVFADIEGSAALWERQPNGMRTALGREDAILRTAIAAAEGYVFKTVGDLFCAAFPTAAAALTASVAAQRALTKETWTGVGDVRVRMALHTGAADERDGDYFGPPLNRVARLFAVGYGGQILLSQATYELIRDSLPDGMGVLDLGEHRLKDLTRPEHIYQVLSSGLMESFP